VHEALLCLTVCTPLANCVEDMSAGSNSVVVCIERRPKHWQFESCLRPLHDRVLISLRAARVDRAMLNTLGVPLELSKEL
jgi:hypothetical protein